MKANELMIGDWLIPYGKTEASKIESLGYQYDMAGRYDKLSFECEPFTFTYPSYCKPVPLTPEILEKNGFTKSTPPSGVHAKCYELDNKKDRYNLTIADYNKYKRLLLNVDSEDSECFNIKCDYVHELQHALRLCKIEKEIEL